MLYRHHIIPRHAGGTDDPANIKMVTLAGHITEHKVLYEAHGRWQDKLAWQVLSGMAGKKHSEESKKKVSNANRGSQSNRGTTWSINSRERRSKSLLGKKAPHREKSYIITFPDGSNETIRGLVSFAKKNNLNTGNLLSQSGSKKHFARMIG